MTEPREFTAYETVDPTRELWVVIVRTHGDDYPALVEADVGEPSGLVVQGLIEHLAKTEKITEEQRVTMHKREGQGSPSCHIRTIRGPYKHERKQKHD